MPDFEKLKSAAEQFIEACSDGNVEDMLEYFEDIFKEALIHVEEE